MVDVTLYERLGGEVGIATIVADFYPRVVGDDLLGPWFNGVDDERIQFHLKSYLTVALGGPEGYTGRSMRQAHAGLQITDDAFDRVLARLVDTLDEGGVDPDVVTRVIAVVATLRPVVVQVPR